MNVKISIILFEEFESLDVFGPVEIFGKLSPDFSVEFYSIAGGIVCNSDNARVQTLSMDKAYQNTDILFVPGGMGSRNEASNKILLEHIRRLASQSKYILSVCTGSLLLSKAGLLKGKKATSNKRAFSFVARQDPDVVWVKKARWVRDGNVYTSSGVTAGMDMALAFVEDLLGKDTADTIGTRIEYERNADSTRDNFAALYD